jgi:cytochrome c
MTTPGQAFALLAVLAAAGTGVAAEPAQPAAEESPRADPVARGQLLFLQCRACHSLGAGEPHKLGPNLHGILGAPAASRPGFAGYSKALAATGLSWTETELDRFLASPARAVPGTTMAFAGLARAEDRAAIIAFLQARTR